MMLLGSKGMTSEAPIFVRIFKEESELEVWKQRSDGRFYHFKTYPICNWSGELGPKLKQGDKQAPEGFYTVAMNQMNPNSSFYLAYNLGFPNAFDRAHDRTGDFLMVHGKCKSAGCYAMTDALIEEIYAVSRDALRSGQQSFHVHAMPFRMTEVNMARHAKHQWMPFWQTLKPGYDAFEANRVPPEVAICERKYVVDVVPPQTRLAADGQCPRFERPIYAAFTPLPEPGAKPPNQSVATAGSTIAAATAGPQAITSAQVNATQSNVTQSNVNPGPLTVPLPSPAPVAGPAANYSSALAPPSRRPSQRPDRPTSPYPFNTAPMNALGLGAN